MPISLPRRIPFPAIAVTAACTILTMAAAEARSIQMLNNQQGMRISASFQTNVPITGAANVEAEAKASENARRSLYDIASRECSIITKVFKGSCRITNLSVRSNVRNRGNGIRQISVSANATYLVTPEEDDGPDGGKKL